MSTNETTNDRPPTLRELIAEKVKERHDTERTKAQSDDDAHLKTLWSKLRSSLKPHEVDEDEVKIDTVADIEVGDYKRYQLRYDVEGYQIRVIYTADNSSGWHVEAQVLAGELDGSQVWRRFSTLNMFADAVTNGVEDEKKDREFKARQDARKPKSFDQYLVDARSDDMLEVALESIAGNRHIGQPNDHFGAVLWGMSEGIISALLYVGDQISGLSRSGTLDAYMQHLEGSSLDKVPPGNWKPITEGTKFVLIRNDDDNSIKLVTHEAWTS